MSQMAPFVDRASSTDRTNFVNTFISYYTWGQVIGLGLDLTLRERSDGRVTLDDFMRALWDSTGGRAAKTPGYVETPYTMNDLKSALAAVSGDAAFAQDFFARYIEGREVVDYARLLARAGFVLRRRAAGRAWAGVLRTQDTQTGARVIVRHAVRHSRVSGRARPRRHHRVGRRIADGDDGRHRARDCDAEAWRFPAGGLRPPR